MINNRINNRKPIAFIPGNKFPAVTITGYSCRLMCDFCRGRYLKGMIPIKEPKELYDVAAKVWERGGKGLLISGGFDEHGRLPIRPYLRVLKDIKVDFDLIVSIHPGFLEREVMVRLKECGVDVIDYEFALNPLLLKHMHLNIQPNDVIKHFQELLKIGFKCVAPHVLLGLKGYISTWDIKAVNILSVFNPDLVVLLIFIPTKGTPLEAFSPPSVREVVSYVSYVAESLNNSEIALGCMRPIEYKKSLDKVLVSSKLIDRIANPHKRLITEYDLPKIEACCSIPLDYL